MKTSSARCAHVRGTALVLAVVLTACGGSSDQASVAIGGTVGGLSTEGLVLSNGIETLALHPSDANFAFPTLVATGTGYSVKVSSQPTSRDQFCTVANGVGTAHVSSMSSVSVSCRATEWLASTLAGSGQYGSQDGPSSVASFSPPAGLAVDADTNVYVADAANQVIRRISPNGNVTTLAGSGVAGSSDGIGTGASFNMPWRVSTAADGIVYVTDSYNQRIRKVSGNGIVTSLSGSGSIGSADGSATAAAFYYPFGLAIGLDGYVYVADNSNQLIRKVAPDGSVARFAGSGSAGSSNGIGSAASFHSPYGVAIDAQGYVYIADTLNQCIRKISPSGVVSTLAGIGTRGSVDGSPAVASFSDPQGVAVDARGNVYVADTGNNSIRKISPSGTVTSIAGNAKLSVGAADGIGSSALFYFPFDVAVDRNGVLYVADWGNLKIRRIAAQ